MKSLNFLKSKEKKKILEGLNSEYGIEELNYLLLETGKKKHRAYSGSLSKEEIGQLNEAVNIELIGLYLVTLKDNDFRLNFDALTLLRNQITKNKREIDDAQFQRWIRGHDLEIPNIKRGNVVVTYKNDPVGIGKSNTEKIFNYIPKERKLKTALKEEGLGKIQN